MSVKVLAVSGGIDSMVLLDSFRGDSEVVVAHFNHGTRVSAKDDAEFVARKAREYGFDFVLGEAKLGENVSEEVARRERYRFLRQVAGDGVIVTAHHREDVIESVIINLFRGTGWRGLAVMSREGVSRPMIKVSRAEIYRQAAERGICFRQDPTNVEDGYLRNRVRERLAVVPGEWREKVSELRERQVEIKREVDKIIGEILPGDRVYQREWFRDLDEGVAMEILRAGLLRAGVRATRVQIREFLEAIKTYAPEKKFNLPGDRLVTLHKTYFIL